MPTAKEKKSSTAVYDSMGRILRLKNESPINVFTPSYHNYRVGKLQQTRKFEYDFAEINRIIDTESLVSSIFRRKSYLILKEDPILDSKNKKNLKYVQKRIEEMEYVSGTPFSSLLTDITESLVSYHNVFLLKNRKGFSSSGLYRDNKEPIASLHILSPTRMNPIENELGDLIGFEYTSKNGGRINIPREDVYHITTDKKLDSYVGTPPLESVKDDILSLRQIEESVEMLVYKNASPFIHVQVGTDDQPAGMLPDGTSEIDYYNNLLYTMEDEGGLTTSHRVKIKLLGSESLALRLENHLEYYLRRVLAGLKASPLDIGQANSISTAGAQHASEILRQDVIAYQRTLERFFSDVLFTDLLLESSWNVSKDNIPEDDRVQFKLFDPGIESKIKYESHLANLYNNGLLTIEEFAKETNRAVDPGTLIQKENTARLESPSNGTFESIALPKNQYTDVEYEVLDSILNGEKDRIGYKLYFYIEDNFKPLLPESLDVKALATQLENTVKKYTSLGFPVHSISKIIDSILEEMIRDNFGVGNER